MKKTIKKSANKNPKNNKPIIIGSVIGLVTERGESVNYFV